MISEVQRWCTQRRARASFADIAEPVCPLAVTGAGLVAESLLLSMRLKTVLAER